MRQNLPQPSIALVLPVSTENTELDQQPRQRQTESFPYERRYLISPAMAKTTKTRINNIPMPAPNPMPPPKPFIIIFLPVID